MIRRPPEVRVAWIFPTRVAGGLRTVFRGPGTPRAAIVLWGIALWAIAVAGFAPGAGAQDLPARLDALWRGEAVPATAFAGLMVIDPADGAVLFERNSKLLFTPASNTKLFSTALALTRLGPDFRAETVVRAEGELLPAGGKLLGDLVLVGAGDPSLSARRFPYSKDTEDDRDYSMPEFEALADRISAAGIREVSGDVVGDDTAFVWEQFREGWAQDDALFEYGAPVSALTISDNAIQVGVRPGARPGDAATVSFRPSLNYFDVLNEVTTTRGGPRRVEWERVNGKRLLLLRGSLPAGSAPWRRSIAIDDPALFAARYLRQALLRRGVSVRGVARSRHRMPTETDANAVLVEATTDGKPLASHLSPPLSDVVTMVNKESQNLFAELLLCQVARVKNGVGSRKGGLAELQVFLRESGVPLEGVSVADASGLARLNLVSPEATARLLQAMWNGKHRDIWFASLPVGGVDGTLSYRFANQPLGARVSAKTGTLRGVSALSGYVTTISGKVLVFSAMVNNYRGSSRPIREFLDKIAVEIAKTD